MTALPVQPKTMTITEAAKHLGISRTLAYQAARSGEIPTITIGRRLLVPVVALDALLAGSEERPCAAS